MTEAAERFREHRLVLRWGTRRPGVVSIAFICSMLLVTFSVHPSTFFSPISARNIFRIPSITSLSRSCSLSPPLTTLPKPATPLLEKGGQSLGPSPISPSSSPFISSSVSFQSVSSSSKSSEPSLKILAPSSLPRTSSSTTSLSIRKSANAAPGCSYTIGKWVRNERKPFYSGRKCRRWLSGMWACRLMPARKSFNYESLRWKPDGCTLPEFKSRDFLARMRNKVIAFVGDSMGRQQFQSLMCMLTGGDDAAWVEDVSKKYGLMKRHGALLEKGTAQRFLKTNTTIIFYWSASLCEIEPIHKSDAHTKFAMHLDRPAVFIRTYLRFMDILILNTGHHWNRGKIEGNKWVMYLDGKVDTAHSRTMADAKSLTIHKVASWLHSQKKKNLTRAEIYMRSLSPRHFFDGEWNSGGRCDDEFLPSMQLNITGHMSDPVIESAISGTSLRLLNITYISQFRFDGHISKYRTDASHQDCLHWCLPGVPDVWNEMLYADILLWQNEQRGA